MACAAAAFAASMTATLHGQPLPAGALSVDNPPLNPAVDPRQPNPATEQIRQELKMASAYLAGKGVSWDTSTSGAWA